MKEIEEHLDQNNLLYTYHIHGDFIISVHLLKIIQNVI